MTQASFNRWLKIGGIAAIALIISPVIFMIIKGVVGLALVAALSLILGALMPAFSEWLTQLKFQSMRFVIDRAPVETLIQRAKERWEALAEQAQLLKEQAAMLSIYKKKSAQIALNFPEEAAEQQQNLAQYERLFALRIEQYKQAKVDMHMYLRTVDKAEAIYDMAMSEAKLSKSFGKNKDFMTVFREKTAFDKIDQVSAASLASLQMAVVDNDFGSKVQGDVHAINYDGSGNVMTGSIFDVEAIRVPALKD